MKYITISEVKEKCLISKTTIYKLMNRGRFPKSITISDKKALWVDEEVNQWMLSRPRYQPKSVAQKGLDDNDDLI